MKKLLVALAAIALACPSTCYAGPFGFNYGETRQEVVEAVGASHVKPGHIKEALILDTAPKPHPNFEKYDLIFSPTKGLLKIIAYGKDVETNTSGYQIQNEFHHLNTTLASIYGPPVIVDSLEPGSIWNDEGDWTMAVIKKDRQLFSLWETDKAKAEHIEGLVLEVKMLDRTTGYLELTYEFDGWDNFAKELQDQSDSVL